MSRRARCWIFAACCVLCLPSLGRAQDEAAPEPDLRKALSDFAVAYTKQLETLSELLTELTKLQSKDAASRDERLAGLAKGLETLRTELTEQLGKEEAAKQRRSADLVESLLFVQKGLHALRTDYEKLADQRNKEQSQLLEKLRSANEKQQQAIAQLLARQDSRSEERLIALQTAVVEGQRNAARERLDAKLQRDALRKELRDDIGPLAKRVARIEQLSEEERAERISAAQQRSADEAKEQSARENGGPSQAVYWMLGFAVLFGWATWFWILEMRKRRELEDLLSGMRREWNDTLENAHGSVTGLVDEPWDTPRADVRPVPVPHPEPEPLAPEPAPAAPHEATLAPDVPALAEPEAPPEKTGKKPRKKKQRKAAAAKKKPGGRKKDKKRKEGDVSSDDDASDPDLVPRPHAPRLLSIRIPAPQVSEGAEEVIQALLEGDSRVLVEPAPRLERRVQGALSVRFFVRGDVDVATAEDLRRACWDLGATSQPLDHKLPDDA